MGQASVTAADDDGADANALQAAEPATPVPDRHLLRGDPLRILLIYLARSLRCFAWGIDQLLKNKLSEYVRFAASGETVLVTDRDRVVAEIVPPQAGRRPLLADALLADAVRAGWLTPPVLGGHGPPPRKPIMAFRDLVKELQQDREDR